MARHWRSQGAQCLHLVDLDGARDGRPTNREAVRSIVQAVDVPCELGGGIRSEQDIREWLDGGLSRVVIGTLAIQQPDWFRSMCRLFPGRLVLGIDARDGLVATHGWKQTSRVSAVDLARDFQREPIAAIVYTDIARDGMLSGPNLPAMAQMQQAVDLPVVASGGVGTVEDVRRLAAVPMAGCILGRALYEGTVRLAEVLAAASSAAGASDFLPP